MPKEAFYTWSGPEPHRKIFELRWAKETDVDPAKTVIYLPPLPEDSPDGVLEMIGNGGDVTELDRLIAALKRAKRAMLGTTTGVDMVVNQTGKSETLATPEEWRKTHGFEQPINHGPNVASGGSGAAPGKYEDEVPAREDLWAQKDLLQEQIAVEEGWKDNDPFPSVYEIVAAYEDESPLHLGARTDSAKASGERVRRLLQERKFNNPSRAQIENHVAGRAWETNGIDLSDDELDFVVNIVQEIIIKGVVK